MRSTALRFGTFLTLVVTAGCGSMSLPLETVPAVDLARYTGLWYEIARYPNFFENGCVGVTAEYSVRDDGRIDVVNTCIKGDLDGESNVANGVARVVDDTTNAKLAVSFFGPFEGPYWIIDLDEQDYSYAVVGSPDRQFLWILSRTPQLDQDIFDRILSELPDKSFDPDRLELTLQPVEEPDASSNGVNTAT